MDPVPLPNLISREQNMINYSCELTPLIEQRIIEYKDQGCQTEELSHR
jgi:hypothetical protein